MLVNKHRFICRHCHTSFLYLDKINRMNLAAQCCIQEAVSFTYFTVHVKVSSRGLFPNHINDCND